MAMSVFPSVLQLSICPLPSVCVHVFPQFPIQLSICLVYCLSILAFLCVCLPVFSYSFYICPALYHSVSPHLSVYLFSFLVSSHLSVYLSSCHVCVSPFTFSLTQLLTSNTQNPLVTKKRSVYGTLWNKRRYSLNSLAFLFHTRISPSFLYDVTFLAVYSRRVPFSPSCI